MKFIGITGGVGAGKSSVLSLLGEMCNCRILLCDEVAANLMKIDPVFSQVVNLPWPESILVDDGTNCIDRKKMAKFIYASDELRKLVDDIVHPAVYEAVLSEVEKERKAGKIDYFFLEAALLIEAGYLPVLDELWYVFATDEVRRERLKSSRGYTDERINGMFASQLSESEFKKHSDLVIDNSYDMEYLRSRLEDILRSRF